MIEKLKTINPYDETEIDMDTNSVGGMVYENTPLIQKINELVDAVNVLQESMDLVQSTLVAEPETRAENVPAPITLIDIFNEIGRDVCAMVNGLTNTKKTKYVRKRGKK